MEYSVGKENDPGGNQSHFHSIWFCHAASVLGRSDSCVTFGRFQASPNKL